MIWYVLPCTMSWHPQNKAAIETDVLVRTATLTYRPVHASMYKYILVCTGTLRYRPVHASMYKYIQVRDVAATPAISIGSVGAAHGEGKPLVLAELVWDRRSRVTSQKQGNWHVEGVTSGAHNAPKQL